MLPVTPLTGYLGGINRRLLIERKGRDILYSRIFWLLLLDSHHECHGTATKGGNRCNIFGQTKTTSIRVVGEQKICNFLYKSFSGLVLAAWHAFQFWSVQAITM
jgi:hypothetical protein